MVGGVGACRYKSRMSLGSPPALPVGGRRFAWRPGERKTVYLGAAVLGVALFFLIVCASSTYDDYRGQTAAHPAPFGDFFALWSYAEVLAKFPATELYRSEALYQHQVAWGMNPAWWNPFPYPPLFMPLARRFDLLPYTASYVAWAGGSLALLLWVVFATCSRSVWGLVALVLAPATTMTIAGGQSGMLAAALMILSLRLAWSRPVWAGLALGVLACKPQLAVLLPIALAASGAWVTLLSAAATALGLGVLASLLYGWEVWPAWLAMLPAYSAKFVTETTLLRHQPTLVATLHALGCPTDIATGAQLAAMVLVAVTVWRLCRRMRGDVPAAAVIVGTFVATPHALIYDMPVVTVALLLFIQHRLRRGEAFTTAEVTLISAVALLPVYMTLAAKAAWVPVAWLCLALTFAMLARAAFRDVAAQPRQ